MKKLFAFISAFLVFNQSLFAVAPDFRISDNEGHTLNINADGTVPISGGGGTGIASGDNATITGDWVFQNIVSIDEIELTGSNILTVPCGGTIQSYVNKATAGDTLLLGSCTYTENSITVNKAIRIVSLAGPEKTIISNTGTETDTFNVTADNFYISGIGFTGTDVQQIIDVDCSAGTTCTNIVIENFKMNFTADGTADAIRMLDAGGDIRNGTITMTNTAMTAAEQSKIIFKYVQSTNEADTTLRIRNVKAEHTCTPDNTAPICRGVMIWNNGADESTKSQRVYIENVHVQIYPQTAVAQTEALQNQGINIDTDVFWSFFDGGLTSTGILNADMRVDDGAKIYLHGTILKNGLTDDDIAEDSRVSGDGVIFSSGLRGNPIPKRLSSTGAASVGISAFNLTAGAGGNTTATGSQTGGVGGGFVLTGGVGGSADSANTASTGGAGGPFTWTGGAGGPSIVATGTNTGGAGGAFNPTGGAGGAATSGTTNTGGAGGAISPTPGAGGEATGAFTTNTGGAGGNYVFVGGAGANATGATTNNGGNGGDLFMVGGAAGTGASANGVDGNIILNSTTGFTNRGVVLVSPTSDNPTDTTNQKLEVRVGMGATNHSSTPSNGPLFFFNRGRGSMASPTIISTGDNLGEIHFQGYDGNSWESTSAIYGEAAGTVSDGAVPSRLAFYTGTTTSQSRRMTIASGGNVGIGVTEPANLFELQAASTVTPIQQFRRNDSTVSAGEQIGEINFYNNDSSLTTQNLYARIVVSADQTITTDAAAGNIVFLTTSPTAGGSPIEALRVSSDQSVILSGNSTLEAKRTTDLGWSVQNAANQACNTTCTRACVFGIDTAAIGNLLACTDATADSCLCAGPT